MAILSKGHTFADGDDVTSTKANNLVDNATFVSGASGTTDDSTLEVNGSGRLQVKDSGVTTGKLAASAVTTAKLANSTATTDGVTFPKMRYIDNLKVIGNVSGSSTTPSEVSILDEDDMASDSATALATQQSIKAYVDALGLSDNSSSGYFEIGTLKLCWGIENPFTNPATITTPLTYTSTSTMFPFASISRNGISFNETGVYVTSTTTFQLHAAGSPAAVYWMTMGY